MKKVLALLLVSALATAAAFAQAAPAAPAAPAAAPAAPATPPPPAFKISGGIETGLYYQTDKLSDPSKTGTIQLLDFDDTGFGTKAYIGALYDAGVFGFKVTLRVDDVAANANIGGTAQQTNLTGVNPIIPYLSEGYAWVAPFDGQLNFKVGAVTETTFSTNGDQGFLQFNPAYFAGAFYGASLVIAPKNSPIVFGALLPVDVNAYSALPGTTPNNANSILGGTTVAAKLTIPNVFDLVAGYEFADAPLWETGTSPSSATSPDVVNGTTLYGAVSQNYAPFGLQALSFGFDLLAVTNLTLNAEAYVPFDNNTQVTLDEKIGVTLGSFYVSLLSYQILAHGTNPLDSASYSTYKLYAGYTLDGGVIPGVYVFYNASGTGTWSIDPNVSFPLATTAGSTKFLIGASIGTNVQRSRAPNPLTTPDIGANVYTGFEFLF